MTGSSGPSYDGAFAIMGAVDPESFDTLHSFSNAFEMPFVTPWFPEKIYGRKNVTECPENNVVNLQFIIETWTI